MKDNNIEWNLLIEIIKKCDSRTICAEVWNFLSNITHGSTAL